MKAQSDAHPPANITLRLGGYKAARPAHVAAGFVGI